MSDVSTMIAKVIESLDKVCPACMAATSDEISAALHSSPSYEGKTCPWSRRRTLCPKQVFVDDGWPPGQCLREHGHPGLCDVYDGSPDPGEG